MKHSCKHIHRLEQCKPGKFFYSCVAHLPVDRDIKTKFPYFVFWTCIFDRAERLITETNYKLCARVMNRVHRFKILAMDFKSWSRIIKHGLDG